MRIHRGLPLRLPVRKDLCTTDVITIDALNYFAKVPLLQSFYRYVELNRGTS